jgi:hypothetical protein
MIHRRFLFILIFGAILGGCQASPWAPTKNEELSAAKSVVEKSAGDEKSTSKSDAAKPGSMVDIAHRDGEKTASAAPGKPATDATAANAQSLQEMMSEVRDLGVLDPQEQANLLENLRQTDPALWPLMVKQVRAAVAYRRQTIERSQSAQTSIRPSNPIKEPSKSPNLLPETEETAPLVMPLGENAHPTARHEYADPQYEDSNNLPKPTRRSDSLASNRQEPALKFSLEPSSAERISKSGKNNSVRRKSNDDTEHVVQASYEAEEDRDAAPLPEATDAKDPVTAGAEKTNAADADWRELMGQTIKALEAETSDQPKTHEEIAKHARLRMLYALAGRREEAAKPIPAAPAATQDFWTKEIYGVSVLLDTERTPDSMTRAAEAKQHFSDGLTRLGEMAPLMVRNLSFCTEVSSFGCYTLFRKNEFLPGQEVLLYAEIENFGIESTKKGYHTSMRSSYQILDSAGQRIADHAISTTEDHCQNPRRDFFLGSLLRMPTRINPGKYTLQLTIEDLKSQKVGQTSIEFTIKGGEKEKLER